MAIVDAALTRLLTEQRRRPPETLEGIAEEYGDTPREQNPQLARQIAGLPAEGRLPAKGTADRRRYDSALRNVQRYRAPEGKQRRRPGAGVLPSLREATRLRLAGGRLDHVRRNGLLMRLAAQIRVSQTWKFVVMPSDTAGHARFQPITGSAMGPALDAWTRGEYQTSGALLLEAFFAAYKLSADVGAIQSVQLQMIGRPPKDDAGPGGTGGRGAGGRGAKKAPAKKKAAPRGRK